MAGATEIELAFGDGDYLFALKLPQVLELQRVCDAGVFKIYGRLMAGRHVFGDSVVALPHESEAFINDVYETIRLGLIGGGRGIVNGEEVTVSSIRARQLLETYVHPVPLKEVWETAVSIIFAKIEGYEGGQKKSPKPERPARPKKASTPPK